MPDEYDSENGIPSWFDDLEEYIDESAGDDGRYDDDPNVYDGTYSEE